MKTKYAILLRTHSTGSGRAEMRNVLNKKSSFINVGRRERFFPARPDSSTMLRTKGIKIAHPELDEGVEWVRG